MLLLSAEKKFIYILNPRVRIREFQVQVQVPVQVWKSYIPWRYYCTFSMKNIDKNINKDGNENRPKSFAE